MKISFYDPDENQPARTDEEFTLDWPKHLGWKDNPFELQGRVAGVEQEKHELNLFFIKKKRFGSIQAESGNSKTTLINWLANALKKEFHVVLAQENTHTSPAAMRCEIADAFRGVFSKGKDLSNQELVTLLEKKARKKPIAILLDDVDDHSKQHAETIQHILDVDNTHVLVTCHSLPETYSFTDELEMTLEMRDESQLKKILYDRIQAVNGHDIAPFSEDIISELAKKATSTEEFLSLAHEAAIHLALNDGVFETTPPKKKEKKKKDSLKKKGRTKYDDLIESLGEELTK